MQKLISCILIFYKPAVIVSILFSALLLGLQFELILVISVKLSVSLFCWYILNASKEKSVFIFYNNLGIKSWQLIFGSFILDSAITLSLYTLISVL